ncbi:hypothetical protein LTR95_015737 [Oleoguttula sp. CCFEE 5521]
MLTLTRLSVLALATISAVLAQDVETDDIPQRCLSVGANVVSLSQGCDTNDNDDTARLQCVCTNPSASTEVPLCNACLTEVENHPDNIARSCSFASTTFASSLTSAASGAISSPATNTAASLTSSTSSAAASATSAAQSTLSSLASAASSAASSAVSSGSGAMSSATAGPVASVTSAAGSAVSSATQAAASQTGNAGAVVTAFPFLGAGAGAVVAALGLM